MPAAAICDDEYEVNREITLAVKRLLPGWEVSSYLSGEDLLSEGRSFDIIFLDVKMKRINGIETAEALRGRGSGAVIIFVSGSREHVFSVFDVGAFHYLLKPVDENKLKQVLERAVKEISEKPEKRRLLIRIKDRSVCIGAEDIIYLENEMRKIAVHTASETYDFYGVMSKIEEQLGEGFYRCHRGYLVNMEHITGYSAAEITLSNGDKVYIAKGKYPEFIKCYHRFLRGKGAAND